MSFFGSHLFSSSDRAPLEQASNPVGITWVNTAISDERRLVVDQALRQLLGTQNCQLALAIQGYTEIHQSKDETSHGFQSSYLEGRFSVQDEMKRETDWMSLSAAAKGDYSETRALSGLMEKLEVAFRETGLCQSE
ncbi:hypothetical protein [Coralliovum pocilloporae]|uniref:hypothetical protein n=1 Tax=Coralliovum pocilloporae TaxID=3066369 RepID=UPI00330716A9